MAKGLRSKSRKKAKKYTYDKDIKPIVQKFQEKLDKKMLVSMYADISKIVDSFGGKITLTTTPEEEDDYKDINKPFTQKDPKRFHFGCMDFSMKEPTEQEIQEALAAKKEKEKQNLEKCKKLGVKLPKTENKEGEEDKEMEEC